MKKETIVLCDVDGVVNIMGDGPFINSDVSEKMLRNDDETPHALFTFSPKVISILNDLALKNKLMMLTSWNEDIRLLKQIGLNVEKFLKVDRTDEITENQSKLLHLVEIAKTYNVIWIDDFALVWIEHLPLELTENVVVIQTHYRQGITDSDLETLQRMLAEWTD